MLGGHDSTVCFSKMASGLKILTEWNEFLVHRMDPRVAGWPLMSTPCIPLATVAVYLVVVAVGPHLMKGRSPLCLKMPIVVYNAGVVLLSAYMFKEFLLSAMSARYSLTCQPVDYSQHPDALRMARVCWLYYVSKYAQLADTVFFILRKKNGQITFLHVYHHATMVINWWLGVAYVAGGQSAFHSLLNTGVHVFMYLYYALSAFGSKLQSFLWWKKYLTVLQLTQYVAVIIHTATNLVVECSFPRAFNWAIAAYALSLVTLFANFYLKTYLSSRHAQKEKTVNGVPSLDRALALKQERSHLD